MPNVTSLFDLIPNCGSDLRNVIPFFDGCDWKLIPIPEWTATCEQLLDCIENDPCFIAGLFHSWNNSVIINCAGGTPNIEVSSDWIKTAVQISLAADNCTLHVGSNTVDLCPILNNFGITITDGLTPFTIGSGDTINLVGLDGMRFITQPGNKIAVGLPGSAQHMQVLTWDDDNKRAVWANNQCCTPSMVFNNWEISTPGGGTVDITWLNSDNQTLDYDPSVDKNLLQITLLTGMTGTTPIYGNVMGVNLTHVNEHTLWLVGNNLSIYWCTWVLHNTVVLSWVNRHTLTLSWNFLSIVSADWMVNDTEELIVNNHVISLVGNDLTIANSNSTVSNTVSLASVNNHTLTKDIANPNIISLVNSLWTTISTLNLSDINRHTLELTGNLLDIIGVDWNHNDQVDLSNVNNHTINIHATDRNILEIRNSLWDIQAVADLHEVNNHYFTITPNATGWFNLNLFNSNAILKSTQELPRPTIFDCTDVKACMATTVASLNGLIDDLESTVVGLTAQLNAQALLIADLQGRVSALEAAIIP